MRSGASSAACLAAATVVLCLYAASAAPGQEADVPLMIMSMHVGGPLAMLAMCLPCRRRSRRCTVPAALHPA